LKFVDNSYSLDKLLTADVVASLIGCDRNSLYRAAAGKIHMPIPDFVKLGRRYRFRLSDVQAFIAGLTARPNYINLRESAECQDKPVKRGRPTKAAQIARMMMQRPH
jgi:predicted DNA-binding transcriptional regulator AlpA